MEPIVTLTPQAAADPVAALGHPPEGARAVEIRVDLLPDLNLEAAMAACPLPVLLTLRSTAEGGRGSTDPLHRRAFVERARDAGADLIDLEFARDRQLSRPLGLPPEQVVLSWHDPDGTPADLEQTVEAMLGTSAGLVKVVPTAGGLDDVVRVLALYTAATRRRRRLAAFAMGPVGMATRLLGPLLGSPAVFCCWDESAPAAPGQMPVRRMTDIAGHLDGPPQKLFGVIGRDVSSSLSPVLHGAAYRSLGLPFLFVPLSVPDSEQLQLVFRPAGKTAFDQLGLPAAGWAVTTPYKQIAAAAAQLAAPRVVRAGAANTLVLRHGAIFADNTDADGVVASLKAAGIDPAGRAAIVRGTGGAARGVAVGLDLAGAGVVIRGRDAARSRETANLVQVGWAELEAAVPDGAVLVNATPLGSGANDDPPFTAAQVGRAAVVVDMVYGRHPPQLGDLAVAAGIPYVDGRSVLAHQGFAQFAAFTGRLPPKDAMLAAVGITRAELKVES